MVIATISNLWRKNRRYRRLVRQTTREVWRQDLDHWLDVATDAYHQALKEVEDTEDGIANAQAQAIADTALLFYRSVEAAIDRKIDAALEWKWARKGGWFRELLEELDDHLFSTLLKGALVAVTITRRRAPLLLTGPLVDELQQELAGALHGLPRLPGAGACPHARGGGVLEYFRPPRCRWGDHHPPPRCGGGPCG